MSTSLDLVLQQLRSLSAAEPSSVRSASDWLTAFERRLEAWQASCALLEENHSEDIRFWGCKFLRTKLQQQFFQLEEGLGQGAADALASCLMAHLSSAAGRPGLGGLVPRYLALCLITLKIQSGSPSSATELFQFFDTILERAPRLVLEFMFLLPEECDNEALDVPPNILADFRRQLGTLFAGALAFLQGMWETSDLDTRVKILVAVKSWTAFAPLSLEELLQAPIIAQSLQNLSTRDDLFVPSLELWIELMVRYRGNLNLAQLLLGYIPEIQRAWSESVEYLKSDDYDDSYVNICKSISQFVNDFAEIFMGLLYSSHDFQQGVILPLLLECAKFPNNNDDGGGKYVSTNVLRFFEKSSYTLVDPEEEKTAYISVMKPYYEALLEAAVVQMAVPTAEEFAQDDMSLCSCLDIRADWCDTIGDCARVMGEAAAVGSLAQILQRELAPGAAGGAGAVRWQVVESAVYASSRLCRSVLMKNGNLRTDRLLGTCPEVATLMSLILGLPRVNTFLSITRSKAIGKFHPWIHDNSEFLLPAVQSLLELVPDAHNDRAAGEAFRSIASSCSAELAPHISSLESFYLSQRQVGFASYDCEINVVHGTMSVAAALSDESATASLLNNLLGPVIQSLETHISSRDSGGAVRELKILTAVSSSSIPERAFIPMFGPLLNICQKILEKFPNENICDEMCSFIKHGLRKSRACFEEVNNVLCTFIAEAFKAYRLSPLLYLTSTLIETGARLGSGAAHSLQAQLIFEISSIFFQYFTSKESFMGHSDIVEEYFFLVITGLRTFPQLLLSHEGLPLIISAASGGLCISDQRIQKMCFLFFQNLLEETSQCRNQAAVQHVMGLVAGLQPGLIDISVSLLSGDLRLFSLSDSRDGSLADMLWALNLVMPSQCQSWLSQALHSRGGIALAQAERLGLVQALSVSHIEEFIQRLDEYADEVRKRRSD